MKETHWYKDNSMLYPLLIERRQKTFRRTLGSASRKQGNIFHTTSSDIDFYFKFAENNKNRKIQNRNNT